MRSLSERELFAHSIFHEHLENENLYRGSLERYRESDGLAQGKRKLDRQLEIVILFFSFRS
jgi:hypothetical protein